MSEYSTDELMGEVQSHLDYGQHMIPTPVCSSIIARLRAADNLKNKSLMKLAADLGVSFSVAKILEDHVRAEYDAKLRAADKLCEAAKELLEVQFVTVGIGYKRGKKIVKAIADYEGKK